MTIIQPSKTLFRIEHHKTNHGMWYRENGELDPFISKLTEGISKNLPMEFDPRYHADGVNWKTATSSKAELRSWFSAQDAIELIQNGYGLLSLLVSEYRIEERQVLFTDRGVIQRTIIPVGSVWPVPMGKVQP